MSSLISTSWLCIRGDWVIVGQRTILVKWLHKPKLQLTQEKSVRKAVTFDQKNPGENPYYTVQHSNFNSHSHPRSSYLPGSGNIWRRDRIHFDHSGLHTQIFDAYAASLESVISTLMDLLANPDVDDDEADVAEIEWELDKCMRMLEELMDRRPFLINDVLLCHNPNDVQEWEKWVSLWADNDDKVWFASLIQSLLLNCLNWRWQKHT